MMKKLVLMLACIAFSAGAANAEISRLPTEALPQGQLELEGGFTYEKWDDRTLIGDGRNLEVTKSDSRVSAAFGVAKGTEFHLSLPYIWKEKVDVAGDVSTRDGIGDLTLGTLLSCGERHAKLASLGFDVKLDTAPASEGGTGTIDYTPSLGFSMKTGPVIPYLTYAPTFRTAGGGNTHSVALGSEMPLSDKLTLDGKLQADFNGNSDRLSSHNRYRLDLSAYVGATKNLFVFPTFSVFYETDIDLKAEGGKAEGGVGFGLGLTLNWRS